MSANERSTLPTGVVVLTCEYPPFPGGIGTYAGNLVQSVRDQGYRAEVIAPSYLALPAIEDEPDTHRILGHHRISLRAALQIVRRLRNTPRDWPFLAADIRTVLFAWATSLLHGRTYRAMIHGSEVSKFRPGSPLFMLVRQAYRSAELICSNSQATLDIFAANFGTPVRSAVTYLAVDPWWAQSSEGSFEHEALGDIPQGSNLFCAVGRIEPRKGQLETIRAIALARDTMGLVAPVLVVAGRPEDESYRIAVEREADLLGVPLIMAGRVSNEDLRRLFSRSVCHTLFARALPGKIEGFGLVLLEAAAQGCPSVATSVGGIPEVMGDCGTLVAPEDVGGFAFALARYARDSGLRTAHGKAARRGIERFNWRACAAETFPELDWDEAAPELFAQQGNEAPSSAERSYQGHGREDEPGPQRKAT